MLDVCGFTHIWSLSPPGIADPDQRDADLIVESGTLFGKTARGGHGRSVKAYVGPLPFGARGIEFRTSVRPHPDNHPVIAKWRQGDTGVSNIDEDTVSIPVIAAKVRY